MAIEFETTVLDIDKEEIENKLKKIGAEKVIDTKFRRWVFDMNNEEWIRLRDEGEKITLTYKKRNNQNIDGTEEIETTVEDFDKTAKILLKQKWKGTYYQENKRIMYILDDIEFCIDSWPKIEPYLEIEGKSEEKVKEGLKLLKLTGKDVGNMSVVNIFAKYGIDLHNTKELKF